MFIAAATAPGKMFYVDCKAEEPEQVKISWGWPVVLIDGQTDTSDSDALHKENDKTVTHAVIEFKENGEVKRVTAETSPYIFKGNTYHI